MRSNCHVYVDSNAQFEMVESIVLNAKTQRPSVCNSIENLLLHRDFFDQYGKEILGVLSGANIGIYGEAKVCEVFTKATLATQNPFAEEFSNLLISIKVIPNRMLFDVFSLTTEPVTNLP